MKEWTEADYAACDTPRTAAMLIQREMDPRSAAPFVEFTRQLEREIEKLRQTLFEATGFTVEQLAANDRRPKLRCPHGLKESNCGLCSI